VIGDDDDVGLILEAGVGDGVEHLLDARVGLFDRGQRLRRARTVIVLRIVGLESVQQRQT
jgi:hypothetical protein